MTTFRVSISLYDVIETFGKGPNEYLFSLMWSGGAYRDRTDDPLLAKQMLSQLS